MMDSTVCARCQSEKIMADVRIVDDGGRVGVDDDLALEMYGKPAGLLFRGKHVMKVTARVCGECGYVELYAKDPHELYAIYQRSQFNDVT